MDDNGSSATRGGGPRHRRIHGDAVLRVRTPAPRPFGRRAGARLRGGRAGVGLHREGARGHAPCGGQPRPRLESLACGARPGYACAKETLMKPLCTTALALISLIGPATLVARAETPSTSSGFVDGAAFRELL